MLIYRYRYRNGTLDIGFFDINQSINQKRIRVTKVTNVTARPLYQYRIGDSEISVVFGYLIILFPTFYVNLKTII